MTLEAAAYQASATKAVSSSSVAILGTGGGITSIADYQTFEVYAEDGDVWINHQGGTASANGANCIILRQNNSILMRITQGVTSVTAIRAGATDVNVVVSRVEVS